MTDLLEIAEAIMRLARAHEAANLIALRQVALSERAIKATEQALAAQVEALAR